MIVSDHVGCGPDLVLPGRTGWIYPTGDVPALRRCLGDALADPARLRRMGAEARRHVATFSFEALTAGLHRALAATLPAGSRPHP